MLNHQPIGSQNRSIFILISLLLLGTLYPVVQVQATSEMDDPPPAHTEKGEPIWSSHSGPWGDLEIRSIYLEAPDSLVAGLKKPNSTTAWHFPGGTEASVAALFERAGLLKAIQTQLLAPERMLMHEGVLTLFADPLLVMEMTLEQRTIIYSELATSPLNRMHAYPAYVLSDDPDDWLKGAHLSEEQKQTVKRLLWKDHEVLAFSDVSILLGQTKSDLEVAKVFKFMTRVRSLVVNLLLPTGVNLQPLADYWTGGGRATEGEPMLFSAAERDSMRSIDITHLLPPTARRRLYTFPTVAAAAEGRLPDCQWTSLNFFGATAHDYFLDARLSGTRLRESYDVVEGPCRYGDVLEFLDGDGNAVHACVYIADNIVYTKNGDGMIKPWVLMWLSDVKKLYLRGGGSHISTYRLKPGIP